MKYEDNYHLDVGGGQKKQFEKVIEVRAMQFDKEECT